MAVATATLKQTLEHTARTRWSTQRSGGSRVSQARMAIAGIAEVTGRSDLTPAQVTTEWLEAAIAQWRVAGTAPGTIAQRLSTLSVMGVDTSGVWPTIPRVPKWYLHPDDEDRLCTWLVEDGHPASIELAFHVATVVRVGMRVEESLRLRWRDLRGLGTDKPSIIVPGTKTAGANATLPLGPAAASIYLAFKQRQKVSGPEQKLYPHLDYRRARDIWNDCRYFLGVTDIPTSTLRSLRRSAARRLHIEKGMPIEQVRDYLRHQDVKTTMGYLRLTGGYGEKEMRKWL